MIKEIIRESRPATLVVTLLSTTLGIVSAYREGFLFRNIPWDFWRIFLITLGGILLQSGVNLVNNYFEEDVDEEKVLKRNEKFWGCIRSREEIIIFKSGLLAFLVTALIGFYMSFYCGLQLLILEIIGGFGAYAYAGKPFNYKKYGLGALMSFIMMGPLMVYGSYFVFSCKFSMTPIVYSLCCCLYIPAILLANELRDYEEDKKKEIGTLTVRIGFQRGKKVYLALIIFSYINTILLVFLKFLPVLSITVVSTLYFFTVLYRYMDNNKKKLVPATAKVYLIFGIQFLFALIL